ncbi:MAG: hypothetical protein ACTSWN_02615 [Promethearchaeota archaeon]
MIRDFPLLNQLSDSKRFLIHFKENVTRRCKIETLYSTSRYAQGMHSTCNKHVINCWHDSCPNYSSLGIFAVATFINRLDVNPRAIFKLY